MPIGRRKRFSLGRLLGVNLSKRGARPHRPAGPGIDQRPYAAPQDQPAVRHLVAIEERGKIVRVEDMSRGQLDDYHLMWAGPSDERKHQHEHHTDCAAGGCCATAPARTGTRGRCRDRGGHLCPRVGAARMPDRGAGISRVLSRVLGSPAVPATTHPADPAAELGRPAHEYDGE
jgi:hypothetical protein